MTTSATIVVRLTPSQHHALTLAARGALEGSDGPLNAALNSALRKLEAAVR